MLHSSHMSAPERQEQRKTGIPRILTIGGQSTSTLRHRLERVMTLHESIMMANSGFTTLPEPTQIELENLPLTSLGFTTRATIGEVLKRAGSRGLDPVPAEAALYLPSAYETQPMDEQLTMGMEPIPGIFDFLRVFTLVHRPNGLRLASTWAAPVDSWSPESEFVFSKRK